MNVLRAVGQLLGRRSRAPDEGVPRPISPRRLKQIRQEWASVGYIARHRMTHGPGYFHRDSYLPLGRQGQCVWTLAYAGGWGPAVFGLAVTKEFGQETRDQLLQVARETIFGAAEKWAPSSQARLVEHTLGKLEWRDLETVGESGMLVAYYEADQYDFRGRPGSLSHGQAMKRRYVVQAAVMQHNESPVGGNRRLDLCQSSRLEQREELGFRRPPPVTGRLRRSRRRIHDPTLDSLPPRNHRRVAGIRGRPEMGAVRAVRLGLERYATQALSPGCIHPCPPTEGQNRTANLRTRSGSCSMSR